MPDHQHRHGPGEQQRNVATSSAGRAVEEQRQNWQKGSTTRGWCCPSACWSSRYGAETVTWRVTEAALPQPSVVVSLTV